MPIPTLISELSTTPASNSPAGSDSPSTLDDIQRAHAAFIAQLRDGKATAGPISGSGITGAAVAGPLASSGITGAAASGANTDITSLGAVASINNGQLAGLRNKIINGDMRVAQRGAVTAGNNSVLYGGADRILGLASGFTTVTGGAHTVSGLTGTSSGLGQYILGLTTTGAGTVALGQRIESVNTKDLNSKTVTFSGWAYQNTGATVTVAVSVNKATALDNFTSVTLIGSAVNVSVPSGVLTRLVVTVALGASDGSNGLYAGVVFTGIGAVTAKDFGVGDLQLEVGSVATAFECRPFGLELALCQRYFQSITGLCNYGYGTGGAAIIAPCALKTTMRATPTIIYTTNGALTNSTTLATYVPAPDGFGFGVVATATGITGTIGAVATATAEL